MRYAVAEKRRLAPQRLLCDHRLVRRRGHEAGRAAVHLVWFLFVTGATAAFLIFVAVKTRAHSGELNGIGFGASLHGSDAAGFFAIFVVPVAIVILLIGHGLIALIGGRSKGSDQRDHGPTQ